jgi:hypothetical protein
MGRVPAWIDDGHAAACEAFDIVDNHAHAGRPRDCGDRQVVRGARAAGPPTQGEQLSIGLRRARVERQEALLEFIEHLTHGLPEVAAVVSHDGKIREYLGL